MSGRSAGCSPAPHHPAASAPGASHSAAPATTSAAYLRTRLVRAPEVEAALGAGTQPAEVAAVQEEDPCGSTGAEEDDSERVAVDDGEHRQRDPGDDRRDRRVPEDQEKR